MPSPPPESRPASRSTSHDAEAVLDLVKQLAEVLVGWSYEGTREVERQVRHVAGVYGYQLDVAVLPEMTVIELGHRTRVVTGTPRIPPLHQVSAMKLWMAEVSAGSLSPAQASARLHDLRMRPSPFAVWLQVVGVALFSAGFGVSVQATWQEVVATGGLGLAVGLLIVAGERWSRWDPLIPLLASLLVGLVVLTAARHDWIDGGPIPLMIPALFMFIPGDALSAAMLELTEGRITAGAARLVQSFAVLAVLAFGALLAAELSGLPHDAIFETPVAGDLGGFAPWIGWAVFSIGVMLAFMMRPDDLLWAAILVFGTYGVLRLGTNAFGETTGTFLAAVAMTVASELLGRSPRRPPAFVLFLGAFFVLTSGGVGLRGLETWIGGDTVAAAESLGDMFELLVALGLGILVGGILAPARPPVPYRVPTKEPNPPADPGPATMPGR